MLRLTLEEGILDQTFRHSVWEECQLLKPMPLQLELFFSLMSDKECKLQVNR